MLGCAVVIASLLAEQLLKLWRARREQVRYDLTPEGRAAAEAAAAAPAPRTGEGVPMVDLDALAEAVARGDLGDDKQ